MNRAIVVAITVLAALTGRPVVAAEPPVPVPECPSISQQQRDAGKKPAIGSNAPSVMPIEKSGILPSAGADTTSAAPTVQQSGQPMPSGLDCPMAPNHPNAPQPGAAAADMPDVSK